MSSGPVSPPEGIIGVPPPHHSPCPGVGQKGISLLAGYIVVTIFFNILSHMSWGYDDWGTWG